VSQGIKFGSFGKKDLRKTSRKKIGMNAWIRLDGGFAVRPCGLTDLSESGVQISIDAAQTIPSTFTLLMSRNAGKGQRARVKWRRGSQIGAEFF
jgi:hypothetical protein